MPRAHEMSEKRLKKLTHIMVKSDFQKQSLPLKRIANVRRGGGVIDVSDASSSSDAPASDPASFRCGDSQRC